MKVLAAVQLRNESQMLFHRLDLAEEMESTSIPSAYLAFSTSAIGRGIPLPIPSFLAVSTYYPDGTAEVQIPELTMLLTICTLLSLAALLSRWLYPKSFSMGARPAKVMVKPVTKDINRARVVQRMMIGTKRN